MLQKSSILFLALSCLVYKTQAQNDPTVFDKFIKKRNIVWASYANDTLSFNNFNLSNELFKRYENAKHKITRPLNRDSLMAGKKVTYIHKNELEQTSFPNGKIDSISSKKINIEQIFYVVNGKLYSYVPWVSPRISVYTSRDLFLGTSEYFSSCINYNYKFKPSKKDDQIFITTTKRKFLLDSFPRADRLKELYGVSMLDAIWKDLINNKNEIINVNSGQKIPVENLQKYFFANTVTIPLYDSLGNVFASQAYNEPISPSLFQQIEITQNWFYDYTKNIVTSNITDVTLFVRSKIYRDNNNLIPAIKIIFK